MSSEQSIAVIRLAGELEIGRRREVAQALTLPEDAPGVLVDCSDATYADSTALAELFRFRAEAARRRIPVAVVAGSPQFARIVEYAGLGDAFHLFDSRAQALSYLAGERLE